jgi:hypothetical protein
MQDTEIRNHVRTLNEEQRTRLFDDLGKGRQRDVWNRLCATRRRSAPSVRAHAAFTRPDQICRLDEKWATLTSLRPFLRLIAALHRKPPEADLSRRGDDICL